MNNTISVIMAAYNCEKTVGKAIDSILAQTYTDWVMIVCDDGSTDGTLVILQSYVAGVRGYNLPDELFAILEHLGAVKRCTFQARLNSAKTRSRGYWLTGFLGWPCYKPYLLILRAFVPDGLYQTLHNRRLKTKTVV